MTASRYIGGKTEMITTKSIKSLMGTIPNAEPPRDS